MTERDSRHEIRDLELAFQTTGWHRVGGGLEWSELERPLPDDFLSTTPAKAFRSRLRLLCQSQLDSHANDEQCIWIVPKGEPDPLLSERVTPTLRGRLQTVRGLLSRIYGLERYLAALPGHLHDSRRDRELIGTLDYVSLDGSDLELTSQTPKEAPLPGKLDVCLASALAQGESCVVLGPAGAGKTTAATKALELLTQMERSAKPAEDRIIPLALFSPGVASGAARDPLALFFTWLAAADVNVSPAFYDTALRLLTRYFRVLLFVDGIDEFRATNSDSDMGKPLQDILARIGNPTQVLITWREEAREGPSLDINAIRESLLDGNVTIKNYWSPEALDAGTAQKLAEAVLGDREQARSLVDALEGMYPEFVRSPLLLHAALGHYKEEDAIPSSPYWLALAVRWYVRQWMRREIMKGRGVLDEKGKSEVLMHLARISFEAGRIHLEDEDFERAVRSTVGVRQQGQINIVEWESRLMGFVQKGKDGHLRFSPSFFRDYFLAEAIHNELKPLPYSKLPARMLGAASLADLAVNADLVCSYLTHIRAVGIESLPSWIERRLGTTRQPMYRKLPPHRHLGANLFLLWLTALGQKQAEEHSKLHAMERTLALEIRDKQFSGMDLSRFQLGRLSHYQGARSQFVLRVRLVDCDFSNCSFVGADLARIKIRGPKTKLQRSNWTFATVHGDLLDDSSSTPEQVEDSIGWDLAEGQVPAQLGDLTVRDYTYQVMTRYCPAGMVVVRPYRGVLPLQAGGESVYYRIEGFYLDEVEVSNGEYLEFVRDRPGWARDRGRTLLGSSLYLSQWLGDDVLPKTSENWHEKGVSIELQPVTWVSFQAAKAYAYYRGKRLPTNLEWALAAKLRFEDRGAPTAPKQYLDGRRPDGFDLSPREWVLDEGVHSSIEDAAKTAHRHGVLNPCLETTGWFVAGSDRLLSNFASARTPRILRGKVQPRGPVRYTLSEAQEAARTGTPLIQVAENEIRHDAGFRCAADWAFVSRSKASVGAALEQGSED